MKKIFLLLIAIAFPVIIIADITGTGTSGDPYTGSMSSGNFNIPTGTSYFNQITVSGGILTIAEGAIVKATQTTSYITISGTGVLNADGDAGADMITFTSNVASWARITFSSDGTSLIDYCLIEKGLVSGSDYGGGLLISSTNITVSNSIINGNTAGYGGGIFVNSNASPTINNCHIYSNTATKAGGGLYIYTNSSALIENCLIDENQCTNTTDRGGGGISTYATNGQARIINCTIVNNEHVTTNTNYGNNIEIHDGNSGLRYINCVVWGGNDPCVYRSGAAQFYATHFVNSAAQSVFTSGGETDITTYTNSFKINSSNEGPSPMGPYFTADNGTDWTLQFRSPCRDAGTIPSPPVPNDYDGNSRIGPYDIGAYEVQYSRWKTDASDPDTWLTAGNWEQDFYPGFAGTTGDVAIPFLSNDTYAPDISGTTTIVSTKSMILEPGAKATFGTLSNSGTLKLESDDSDISSLIVTTYSGNDADIELYLTGEGAPNKWHYISSPFTSLSTTPFSAVTLNLAQYIESLCLTSLLQGWVAYDGFVYSTASEGGAMFSTLTSGTGYNFYDNVDNEITISGQLKTVNVTPGLSFSDHGSLSGFNLLGNPFSSGLDWDVIIDDASYPDETSKGVYFTKDNAQCSYIGGVGTPESVTGIIPPMQGFFTKTYSADNIITLLASARTHNSIHARYKGKSTIPLIRLSITKDTLSDETVVRFDEQAKPGLDYDFDAVKMFLSDNKLSIYSYDGETKYAINGQPFPENSVDIPLVINSPQADTLKIIATQIQGLEDYDLILKDMEQDFNINELKYNEYIFFADSGSVTDRFILTITKQTTGLPDIFDPEPEKAFNIYSSHGILYINPANDEWNGKRGDLRIYDITGRIVKQQKNIEWYKGVTKEILLSVAQGIYFVEIRAGGLRYVGKVSVR